jgi:DNA-binding ferritin-like protein (Dps family)
MANGPQNITVSLTAEQVAHLLELQKITGKDTTTVVRAALADYYQKIMEDEEGKEIAKINAFLDVQ